MAEERDDARRPGGQLSEQDRNALLRVARLALTEYLTAGRTPSHSTESSVLLEHRGAFVSLHRRDSGALRGCLGEFLSERPLIESVKQMAIAAATRDPRFAAVTVEELPELQIEISALTPLYPIRPEQIQVGVHGLMIVKGGKKDFCCPMSRWPLDGTGRTFSRTCASKQGWEWGPGDPGTSNFLPSKRRSGLIEFRSTFHVSRSTPCLLYLDGIIPVLPLLRDTSLLVQLESDHLARFLVFPYSPESVFALLLEFAH